jgi:DNA-binding CsgD family transcriptional regulator
MKRPQKPKNAARGRPLTARQKQVMALVVRGLNKTEMAKRLGLSPATIGMHLRQVYRKLGVHNRASAVVATLTGRAAGAGFGLVCAHCGRPWKGLRPPGARAVRR